MKRISITPTAPLARNDRPHARPVALGALCAACLTVLNLNAQTNQFLWAKRIAATTNPSDELAIGFALDSTTNLYLAGWFDGTNDFGGVTLTNEPGGGQDAFVAKYDAAGSLQWARRAGGDTAEMDVARGVGVDAAGNVYVAGGFSGTADFGTYNLTANQGQDFFLVKYNSSGTVQWVRQSAGGGDWAYATALAVDSTGNSYAVGYYDGASIMLGTTTLPNPGDYNVFLVKYDSAGDFQWAKALGGPASSYSTAVALDTTGNVYVTGSFSPSVTIGTTNLTSAGLKDGFVAKFNSTGVFQWARQMGGPSDDAGIGAAAVDASGNLYVVGGFGNTAGDTISFGPGVTLTNLGGGLPGTGVGDAFLAKYNSTNGAVQWARRAGGPNMDAYTGVTVDAQGNIYAAGGSGGTGMPAGFTVWVTKYDTSGNVQWTQASSGSNGAMSWNGPLLDPAGNSYVAGWFHTSTTMGTNALVGLGYWDVFLAELGVGSPSTGDFLYAVNGGAVTITGYTGAAGAVTIPGTINGLPVTAIAAYVFTNQTSLTSVSIPDSVTTIGEYAFYYCNHLVSVNLGHGLTSIGNNVFAFCTSLGSLTIPSSVTSIGYAAFQYCWGLTNLVIPASVTSIADVAFNQCTGLKGVFFLGNAPTPGNSIFAGAGNETVYYLPARSGWGANYGGRPALLWNPQAQNLGVRTNQFGFDITGTASIPLVVEACTNLALPNWVALQNSTLTNGLIYFSDPQWTDCPMRFYRFRAP